MLQTPYLNPGWTHTLCDFALHAIAVFMQLIAGNADVQTNCECGTSGFGKGIICLISGTPHDMMVDSAWTTKMFDAMLRSSPQCAARDLLTMLAQNSLQMKVVTYRKVCLKATPPCSHQQQYRFSVCTITLWVCTLWASDVAMNTDNLLAVATTPALLRAVFHCHQHCLSAGLYGRF